MVLGFISSTIRVLCEGPFGILAGQRLELTAGLLTVLSYSQQLFLLPLAQCQDLSLVNRQFIPLYYSTIPFY